MKRSKLALVGAALKSNVQLIAGSMSLFMGLVGFGVESTASPLDPVGIVLSGVFLLAGVVLLVCSFRTKRLMARFRVYVSILSNQSSMSISELSMTLGESQEKVESALQAMIERRFFASAYIDRRRQCLVFPLMEMADGETQAELDAQPHTVVTCKVCGGNNRVPVGKRSNCMYCDHVIQG